MLTSRISLAKVLLNMTTPLKTEYTLKALALCSSDAVGREWAKEAGHTLRSIRLGNKACQFKGYPRDLPVYILRPSAPDPEFLEAIDQIRERFKTTREVRL